MKILGHYSNGATAYEYVTNWHGKHAFTIYGFSDCPLCKGAAVIWQRGFGCGGHYTPCEACQRRHEKDTMPESSLVFAIREKAVKRAREIETEVKQLARREKKSSGQKLDPEAFLMHPLAIEYRAQLRQAWSPTIPTRPEVTFTAA